VNPDDTDEYSRGVIRLVVIGAGGHARVIVNAARTSTELEVVGLISPGEKGHLVDDVPIVGGDDDLPTLRAQGVTHAIVGVGSLEPGTLRAKLFDQIHAAGLIGAVVVHRDATVSPRASIGEGSMVFAGVVINPGVRIGRNVIVNTGAIVEHDCIVDDHAHLLPGAIVGGAVRIGTHAHIGIGAVIVPRVSIGARALVAAGAVVTADVPDDGRVTGNPVRSAQ
jgi:sugar O-acyltransferase (sialic acid O-acetyltransferase NeuD family)